jgi:hypothetical protein
MGGLVESQKELSLQITSSNLPETIPAIGFPAGRISTK